jgi:dethiobiotin synthetase
VRLLKGVFITGTDTGVGKTAVAAGIAGALRQRGYRVGVMKPVQSGAAIRNGKLYSQDAEFMINAACSHNDRELVSPVLLREALAPAVAAKIEGRTVDLDLIKNAYMELERLNDLMVVEGAGGIAVPVKDKILISDLIALLDIPIIIVGRPGLGTINHTLLTVEHAKRSGISIIGIVLNNYTGGLAEKTNPEIIEELTGIPILGVIPYDPGISTERGEIGNIISLIQKNIDIETITGFLVRGTKN